MSRRATLDEPADHDIRTVIERQAMKTNSERTRKVIFVWSCQCSSSSTLRSHVI